MSAMKSSKSSSRKNMGKLATILVMGLALIHLSSWSGGSARAQEKFFFNFPDFSGERLANLTFYDDAVMPTPDVNFIDLVPTSPDWNRSVMCKGKFVYKYPIHMKDVEKGMVASWATSFGFRMKRVDDNDPKGGADGMVFMMVGDPNATGNPAGEFGIFKNYTAITSTFALELDTYRNMQFPDGGNSHVGIDINSTTSVLNKPTTPMVLNDGSQYHVWIEYDYPNGILQVRFSDPNSKTRPGAAFMKVTNLDLSDIMLDQMWVGFSAGSSQRYQFHTVYDWRFYSHLDSKISTINSVPSPDPDDSRPPSLTTTGQHPGNTSHRTRSAVWPWAVIVAAVATGVVACIAALMCCTKRRAHKVQILDDEKPSFDDCYGNANLDVLVDSPHSFCYSQLSEATDHFSEKSKLGTGGFGSVFRGVISATRRAVAVKRLSDDSKQGEKEFVSEISIISRLRHRNLVQLLGWCQDDKRKELLLVYELLPHGSLDKLVLKLPEGEPGLSWPQRLHILRGVASALEYLHEGSLEKVIHRDVKCSNVMLDGNYNAKLGDFGLARVMDHMPYTTRPAGSLGYIAPETYQTGKANDKSDVYSFGALALEVVCGRKALDMKLWGISEDGFLVDWVWGLFSQTDEKNPHRVLDAVDERMKGDYDVGEVIRVLQIGLLCSHPLPESRPSMRQIVHVLAGEASVPPVPKNKPVPVYDISATVEMYV